MYFRECLTADTIVEWQKCDMCVQHPVRSVGAQPGVLVDDDIPVSSQFAFPGISGPFRFRCDANGSEYISEAGAPA